MERSETTLSVSGPRAPAPPPPHGLDRDLAFAEAERRLLGKELHPVTLDRFVVLHRLGQGAMGVVYAAHDPKLDRKVALKLVDARGDAQEGASDARARIEREARAAADLAHPNVVTIYDTGTVGDQVFLAMEFIDGTTLRAWLRDDHPWREIVSLFVEIGRGLWAAHQKGIVHRDFKPDNVLVGKDGRPRVVDFGLARPVVHGGRDSATAELDGTPTIPDGSDRAPITGSRDTSIAGTPAYMAPEQYEGRNVGPHSDQFGFCVALYEALYGERPFVGDNPRALAHAVLEGRRRPVPRGHGVPPAVLAAVQRGLARAPQDRHRSMQHLIGALVRARDARRRRVMILGAAAALVGTGLGTYAITHSATPPPPDPCAAAEAPLRAVWNEDRRERLAQVQAQAMPFARGSWSRVEPKLDRFGERWGQMRRQACEDAQHRGSDSALVLELRYACLDRALARFDAFVGQLEQPGPTSALLGPTAVDGIDRLWRCEDREQLVGILHANGLAAHTDSTRRADGMARWHAGYERLAQADVLYALGQRDPALEQVRGVIDEARATGLRALEAEAQLSLGRWTGDPKVLEAALQLALAAGPPDQAAEVALGLAELGREAHGLALPVAREHLRYARGLLDRVGPGQAAGLRVRLPAIEGALALREGDNRTALDHFDAALAQAALHLPDDHTDGLAIRGSRATTLQRMGRTEDATAALTALMQAQARVLGPHHPDVGKAAFNLGVTALEDRRLDDAERHFERAREIWTAGFGEDHPQRAGPMSALGEVHRLRGELSQAQQLQSEALRIRQEALGPDHPRLCVMLDELGELALARGQPGQARAYFERSLAIRRAHPSPHLATTLTKLGRALMADGESAAAREHLEEALALRSSEGIDPVDRAETELALARVLHAEGDERARALALAARDRLRAVPQRRSDLREDAERWYTETFGAAPSPR